MFRRIFARGEYTQVSRETEIGIPQATYGKKCLMGVIFFKGGFVISMLVWIMIYIQKRPFMTWLPKFGKFASKFWPMLLIPDILWCITIPLWMWFIRMTFEQLLKQ
jgi:hypothetical protein